MTISTKERENTDEIVVERESELAEVNRKNAVELRSNIRISQFPDYVLKMTDENVENTSNLAAEYLVSY